MSDAWIVGGALRDELLGPPGARRRRRGRRRPRARRPRARGAGAGAGLPAVGGVRRLAGDRPRAAERVFDFSPLQGETIEERPAPSATSRSTRWRAGRAGAQAEVGGEPDRPARRPRRPRGSRTLRVLGPRGLRERPAARRCAWPASPPSSASRRTPRPSGSPRAAAPRVAEAAGERVFAELRRLVIADGVLDGLELADRLGVLDGGAARADRPPRRRAEPLPPPRRLRPHARGAGRQIELESRSTSCSARAPRAARACSTSRSRDELTRGQALRFGALAARHRQAGHARRPRRTAASPSWATTRVGEQMVRDALPPPAHERALRALRRGAHPPPPRARLPRARAPARPRARSTATCAAPSPWRSR